MRSAGETLPAAPRDVGGCLATGVRQLNTGYGPVPFDESDETLEGFGMCGRPDARIPVGDPRFRRDPAGLDHHQPRATDCARAEVNVVPVVWHAVVGGVLTHRGDPDAI